MSRKQGVIPNPRDGTLTQQLSRAFILFGTIVAGAFLVTALAFGASWFWLTPEFERSAQAVRAQVVAYTATLEEENRLQGYLLTGDPRLSTTSVSREERLLLANETLDAAVTLVPSLAALMITSRMAEERWRQGWAKVAAAVQSEANTPFVSDDETLFAAYREAQVALAAALERHNGALGRRMRGLVAARVALELGVFLAVLLLSVRQHRALHDAIVTPVAALLRHIRGIRDGQLEATVDSAAPRELAQLAEGLNEVVQSLAVARASKAQSDEIVRQHSVQLRLILDASREFSESLNLAYVVNAVRESTGAVGGYERVVVWIMDDERKCLVDADNRLDPADPDYSSRRTAQGPAQRAAKAGRITFEGPTGQVRFNDSNPGPVRAIAIPLIVGARVVGALEARHGEPKVANTQTIELLETLATHAATAIESARLHEVIERRSQMDALTRLFNRGRLEEDLDAEVKRSIRYGRPLAFVMLDVDNFKAFNDTHGHPQGDITLQQVAEVINGCVRTTDSAYRYGGEEFCVLLRETSAEDGMLFAERVRRRIEKRFTTAAGCGTTVSVGVAGFSSEAATPRALMETADAAMYESKHAGKNRVTLSAPSALPTAIPLAVTGPVRALPPIVS